DDVPNPDVMFSATNIIGNTLSLALPVGLGRLGFDMTYPFVRYAWAVAIELLFYYGMALVALIALRYMRPANRAAFRWSAAALLGTAAFLIYALSSNGYPLQWAPYFVLGVSLYHHATTVGAQRTWALVAILASLVFINWHAYEYIGRNPRAEAEWALLILDVLIAVLYFLSRVSLARRWIRMDQFLGDLTYPLYLNHYLVGIVFLSLVPSNARSPALFVGSLVAATLFAYVAMQLSEPFTRRLRASIRGRALS
ncbi:MAG TPA: acyltransferase family protein, partial [Steroidobacteraceae bacterium]|nr:acyltransferase family protein [Steroidobacteraceae bacterium]